VEQKRRRSFSAIAQARAGNSATSSFGRRQYTSLTQRLLPISINSAAHTIVTADTAARKKDLIVVRHHGEKSSE
jgi:hypothetical protein